MTNSTENGVSQAFLDANQYSVKSILRYERIFGHNWVSTGGENTTKEFCHEMKLKPGQKVLDVGCGTGGSAFYMAREYGCHVLGIDLSSNMIAIADHRLLQEDQITKKRVSFQIADVLDISLPNEGFDVIYSRDTILHIKNKEKLFTRFLQWLKPGGTLLITDYMRGDKAVHSTAFQQYVKDRGYFITTIKEYGSLIESAGFKGVQTFDMSKRFKRILEEELKYFNGKKEAFESDFSKDDYETIVNGWTSKIQRVNDGDQVWGLFIATK